MGLGIGFSSSRSDASWSSSARRFSPSKPNQPHRGSPTRYPVPPEPIPHKFKMLMKEKVGNAWIALVAYEGCTTFDGQKLLVCNNEPKGERLDPHLLGTDHLVVARFQPNELGFKLARICAKEI